MAERGNSTATERGSVAAARDLTEVPGDRAERHERGERGDRGDQATLVATSPLAGRLDDTVLAEVRDLALVTIILSRAPGSDGEAVRAALASAFGVALPAMGASCVTERDERLLGLQDDRLYVLFEREEDPERALAERLGDAATVRLNDQSDAWVMLRLSGTNVRGALERVCPLDLHPAVFAPDAVARTVCEHLATIIVREADDTFLLLSPRSSARDFLHEIETSIRHARG